MAAAADSSADLGQVLTEWFNAYNDAVDQGTSHVETKAGLQRAFEKAHAAEFVFVDGDKKKEFDRGAWMSEVMGLADKKVSVSGFKIESTSGDTVTYSLSLKDRDGSVISSSTCLATFKGGKVCRVDDPKPAADTAAE